MKAEQLFVETLVDVDRKLANNPGEYELVKIAGLLRPILLETLLDDASAAAAMDPKFRVVKPGPMIPPDVKAIQDAAWAKLHATQPDIQRVDVGFAMRPDLMSGELGPNSRPGDRVVELSRKDFLKHAGILIYNDFEYTVEDVLRVTANSEGGIHLGTNRYERPEELRQHSGGSEFLGRPLLAAMMGVIANCTLRTCVPVADELTRRGLYRPAPSDWVWSADGHCSSP